MQNTAYTSSSGQLRSTAIPAFKLIEPQLHQVTDLIDRQLCFSEKAQSLKPLLAHIKNRHGKLLRPGLLLLSAAACGPITDQHLRAAAVLEMIHTATLLHDDVIDQGQQRRGQPTVNHLWGNPSAVLLGDFLLGKVFQMCAELSDSAARTIADMAVQLCEGELRQISQIRNWDLTEQQYIDIITDKSAALLGTCCQMGAALADAPSEKVQALSRFGLYAGIAFQIADDLLDLIGDERVAGKSLQRDAEDCKPTLPLIHLMQNIKPADRPDLLAALDHDRPQRTAVLLRLLRRYHSLDYARLRAAEYVRKAEDALGPLPPTAAKDALIATAHFMADRSA